MGQGLEKQLSEHLLSMGFFSALGNVEQTGGTSSIVTRGNPFTYDSNNGVVVIYDEKGRPWIGKRTFHHQKLGEIIRQYHMLRRGAYVPHSNDGGNFVNHVLPTLGY